MVRNFSRATPAYAKRKHPGGNTLNTGVVIPLILGWNGFKHPGVGGVSTRVLEVCESNGCALTLQCMRSAKAEGVRRRFRFHARPLVGNFGINQCVRITVHIFTLQIWTVILLCAQNDKTALAYFII